jgi:hypothetical protein
MRVTLSLLAFLLGASAGGTLPAGIWGGDHIRFEATDQGANVEFDCAHASLPGPVTLDGGGRFSVTANLVREHGGPIREGEAENGQPARWEGKVAGDSMRLTVTLTGSGETVGTFELVRGREPRLTKCL